MFTFIEEYSDTAYTYTQGVPALKEYILDILNTERGTRPYYPDYGLLLEKFKYTLLTPATAQRIHSEVYYVIESIENITILATNYTIDYSAKKLSMYFDVAYGQEPIGLHLTYTNGGFR